MLTVLKNNNMMIEVNSLGAELWSLKRQDDTFEYLWQGDATYWTGRSPVLFPNVGAVKNNMMRIDGVEYSLGNHGFAKKSEFELVETTSNQLVYRLKSNDETLTMYPYQFELTIAYTLEEGSLSIDYTVKNNDHQEIYFQLGTHPGFNCPMDSDLKFEDYYLQFNEEETTGRLFFDGGNLLVTSREEEGLKGRKMSLRHDTFYEGAAIFKNIKSSEITLKSETGSRFVKLSYNKFPYLGVWQKPDAPYICIEPWHGISDPDNYTGEFKNKEMIIKLEKSHDYKCYLKIEI